jgi:proline dehydrogenase
MGKDVDKSTVYSLNKSHMGKDLGTIATDDVTKSKQPTGLTSFRSFGVEGQSQMHASVMSKRKSTFEVTKDHGRTPEEIKRFSKPNLDEGNRYFEDNRRVYENFAQKRSTTADLFD